MPGLIPEEQLQRVRDATDIVALIQEYVPLKRAGSGFKGLCPFHDEKTPSFHVNPNRQIFKCFGCSVGGDVITFVMKHDGLEFLEAVRWLARRAGVEIVESAGGPRRQEPDTVYDVTLWAAKTFLKRLHEDPAAEAAREYLKGRRLDDETVREFRLGYAAAAWDELAKAAHGRDIGEDDLLRAGLVLRRESGGVYDRFRGRLMFPILDVRRRVIGFGARSLDGSEPKYLNSPETGIFQKGRAVYGLPHALDAMRKTRRVVVVEGYTDVMMAYQQGLKAVVAVLGTALTRDHVRLLRRHVDEALLLFDADAAGQNSADRSVDAFAVEGMAVRVCRLPDGLDPCDFFLREGAAGIEYVEQHAEDIVGFKLQRAVAAAGGRVGYVGALDPVLAMIAAMPDPNAQDAALRRVCDETGLSLAAATARTNSLRRRGQDDRRERRERTPQRRDAERELLQALLAAPATIGTVRDGLDLRWVGDALVRNILTRALDLAEEGVEPHAGALLAQTSDPDERGLIEALLSCEPPDGVDCGSWCADLVARLQALHEESHTGGLQQRLRETDSRRGDEADLTDEERRALEEFKANAARRQRSIGLGRAYLRKPGEN